jgi:hypothetical protein
MDVLNARDKFKVELASLLLRKSITLDNIVEQLATIAVLHDHVIQLNNIWMSDLLQDLDFPRDSLNILLIVDFIFFQDLYGYL